MSDNSPLQRPATIRTVADRAGVSKSLVSLVLQGSRKVSAAKRQAVQQAIDELGYRPNAIARQLTERRTNMVGVLLNDLRNPWFVDCLDGLTSVLHGQGLRTLLADGRLDRSKDDALLQGFLELRVDGLVLVGSMASSPTIVEAAASVPTVVAASRDITLPQIDVVANDDWVGTELAVAHLIGLGHTRIAHLAGSLGAVADLRRRSYLDTMRRHGLDGEQVIESSDMTEEGGYRAAVRLLSRPNPPTAIFAVNDITCVGAMSAAQELGLRVPNDISLVGYDNTSLAQIRHLWLTSVDNASVEVGQLAARALLRRITDPTAAATEQLLRPSLKIRGSTAPLAP
ncbi:MAG: LacI family DNA-binding transcriptional regulator [Nakamurella sp.]